jgi:predicted transposase YbfD/YdcC
MQKYTPLSFEINLGADGFVFDVQSLIAALMELKDLRDARGLRYALVTVLVFVILAKLSGEDFLRGIAQWVKERQSELTTVLGLAQAQAPHYTTYGRILGHAVEVAQLEKIVSTFFTTLPGVGRSLLVNIDGKTLRGTLSAGQTQGVHLLAVYLPGEGVVLAQVEVTSKENEIPATPRVLTMVDLHGKSVTTDALLTQRKIAIQIVEAGGEYVLPVKDNQPQLLSDIQTLFAGESCVKGFSPAAKDFRQAEKTEKGHGRIEKRTLTVSGELKGYDGWPYAEQVFKLERESKQVNTGKLTREVAYGITSLTRQEADATRLLEITRAHWGIESGLHFRRDVTLHEDRGRVRQGHGAHAMAVINNIVLGLFARLGYANAAEARRHFAAHFDEAVNLVLRAQT